MQNRSSFSIFDASAGAGKTYNLVKQYLLIILSSPKNDAYRHILAITFTNKAVHEMKSRIVDNLSEFAKDLPNKKAEDLLNDLVFETKEWKKPLSISGIKTKSQQIIKHIIHNYAAFDISTIDKFTHKVIRAFAHDLGLPMTFEVTLDTESLLTEAVDALIAKAGEDEIITRLLIDFTMEKTDDDKSWDISKEILETGRLILNENNREAIVDFKDKKIEDFLAIKSKIAKAHEMLENENIALATSAFSLLESNQIDSKSFAYETFPKHIQFIISKDARAANHKFESETEVKIKKDAKNSALIESVLPQILSNLAAVYANNERKDFYKAFLKNITPLSLLNTVNNELSKIQTEQNVLSISEFNAIIHNEIQNQPAPFIYERLGEKYRHFFIDEFQDTSEMQWQNLIPLIDNATSGEIDGEKGTLMIVGDPKQSIYRWRGGKAEQFIALSKNKNPFNNPDKTLEHLKKNFRSYSEIINFNNAFFKFLSSEFENEDYKDLYENHSTQEINNKIGGFVNVSFIPKIEKSEDENEEALNKTDLYVAATLSTIKKAIAQGFIYKDIVILTRKRSQGIAIANYLTEQKIAIISSETLMIQNATEVKLIINILKYLNNSENQDAKAHFLEYLAKDFEKEIAMHDFMSKGMSFENEVDFEEWLVEFDLKLSFKNLRKKSLYEAVEIIITTFFNASNLKVINGYVQYFQDIVLERDIRNQAGIADFLNFWDKNASKYSIPSPEGNNAVRIMTIHKSKGLEFPVVIMPFADEDYSRSPKNKLWLATEDEDFGLSKVLIDNSSAVKGFGENAKSIYNQKKQEELLDNVNILYVALTRAEEQLYIISDYVKPNKEGVYPNNMASFFIKYLESLSEINFDENILNYDFGMQTKLSLSEKHIDSSKTIPFVTSVLNPKNIKIAQREALMWGTQRQDAIEYGNLIHEILSFVNNKNEVNLAIEKALENGLIKQSQKEAVTKTIIEIVNHKDLSDFFTSNDIVLNEQVIIQQTSSIVKPDRMVLKKNQEVYLLDYKTGAHQSKYALQIENYQKAIEEMGFKVVKKALVYIGEKTNVVNF